jgi:hypothetical protein
VGSDAEVFLFDYEAYTTIVVPAFLTLLRSGHVIDWSVLFSTNGGFSLNSGTEQMFPDSLPASKRIFLVLDHTISKRHLARIGGSDGLVRLKLVRLPKLPLNR